MTTTTAPQLTVKRTFAAPRALVYRAFTDPDQFAAWWGPFGNYLPREEIDFDVRPGGHLRWREEFPAEPRIWTHGSLDLSDVVEGELLEGTMRIAGQLPAGYQPFDDEIRIEFRDKPDGGQARGSPVARRRPRVADRERVGRGVQQARHRPGRLSMGKVMAGGTVSLDGYIAGPNNSGWEHLFAWFNSPGRREFPSVGPNFNQRRSCWTGRTWSSRDRGSPICATSSAAAETIGTDHRSKNEWSVCSRAIRRHRRRGLHLASFPVSGLRLGFNTCGGLRRWDG